MSILRKPGLLEVVHIVAILALLQRLFLADSKQRNLETMEQNLGGFHL